MKMQLSFKVTLKQYERRNNADGFVVAGGLKACRLRSQPSRGRLQADMCG
jgi:hypothetical protein